jgi:hypothetical protein
VIDHSGGIVCGYDLRLVVKLLAGAEMPLQYFRNERGSEVIEVEVDDSPSEFRWKIVSRETAGRIRAESRLPPYELRQFD